MVIIGNWLTRFKTNKGIVYLRPAQNFTANPSILYKRFFYSYSIRTLEKTKVMIVVYIILGIIALLLIIAAFFPKVIMLKNQRSSKEMLTM